MTIRDRALLTTQFDNPAEFRPIAGSTYVYGVRDEDRTRHLSSWQSSASELYVIELAEVELDSVNIVANDRTIALRDKPELMSIFDGREGKRLYLDITGLSNHVWPAVMKAALSRSIEVIVVYVEPRDYAYSAAPRENVFFDLSDRILGIAPIPQFNNLSEPDEEDVTLIPLLGFEGARFAHLLEEVQPPGGNIDPIIGIPGFRAEYPFYTYQGNQIPLKSSRAYQNVRFAKANCPFSLFYTLQEIEGRYPARQFFKIGLIGTKPHALGAVLFAIANPRRVELVYDHTRRRKNRTEGQSHCIIYPVSDFLSEMAAT